MKRLRIILYILLSICTVPLYCDDFYSTLRLAQQGNVEAQYNLGHMYENGHGVSKDISEAYKWYVKAAENGNDEAQCALGYMYATGDGVLQDYMLAFKWYSKAAELGNIAAQGTLGHMYEVGEGIAQDYQKAIYWYKKSAERGYVQSQTQLGTLFARGEGVPQNYKSAFTWFLKAAEQGDAYAQDCMGFLYMKGLGVPQNYPKAYAWFIKAADQGYSDAQSQLGYMYMEGLGGSKNYELAYAWNLKAARQGDSTAQYNLGHMYENGYSVTKDVSKAMMWFHRASIAGLTSAKARYDKLKSLGFREATDDPPLLSMEQGSLEFLDESMNNQIDADEKCTIKFKLVNNGKGDATNCEALVKMVGASNGVSVSNVKLPTITSGKTYDVSISITSDINTIDGNVTFSIEVYEPNGWGVAPFDMTVATKAYEPPYLQVVDYSVTSASGKIRKMEPFTLTFNLQNTKYGVARDVKIKVRFPDNIFIMDGSSEIAYSLIKSGEAKPIQLTLAANNNYAVANIPISIEIKEKYGRFAENKDISLALNQTASSSVQIAAIDEPQTERKEIQLAMIKSDVDRNIPTTEIKNDKAFVLIVANEHYSQEESVPFALNDGNIFKEYCVKTLGVGEKHIKFLTDATGNQIKAGVNWLANLTEVFDDPQIIVYYAGHGIPDEASRSAYILPVDGSGMDVSTGYKLDELYSTLGKMPASKITVFMDACFSGSKREDGMLASARGVALKAKSGVPQGNMVVFSAAQGNETAYPNREQQHGLFTYYLLKKLQETEGDVALKDLGDYVTKQVSQQSLLLNSKKQTPCVTPSATVGTDWENWKLK